MRDVASRWLAAAGVLAAFLIGATSVRAETNSAESGASAAVRVLMGRPVEVASEGRADHHWLTGLIDAYMRLRFTGRDEFHVIGHEQTVKAIPAYANLQRSVGEDAYFRAAKPLGARFVLLQKYEYVEKEQTVHYYVELIEMPGRKVVSSFEKSLQVRTLGVELDDAVLRLFEQLKLPHSDRAQKFFDHYLISPDPGKQRKFGELIAEEYYGGDDEPEKIAREYAELAHEISDMAIGYWMAGQTCFRLGKYRDALTAFGAFHKKFPAHGPVHELMCAAYRLDGQHGKAVEMARAARAQGIEPFSIMVELLRGLEATGKKDEAYAVCLEVLERAPKEPFALHFVARWRVDEGRFEEGLEYAEQLLAVDANHGGAHLEKGRALVGLKKTTEAIMPLTQATVLLPKDPAPQIELADIYYAREDYAKAAGHYAQACKLNPDDLELFLRTAEAYERAKNLKAAEKTLLTIEPKYPDELRLNAKLGLIQYRLDDTAGARVHLEKRIKSRVDDSLVFLALGDIYTSSKEYMKAINVYEQALPLVKGKNRLRTWLAQLFLKKKEPNNALPYLQQIVEQDPNYPDVYRYFGDAYRDAGEAKKAIEHYKRQRKESGADPYVQEQIAALHFKLKEYDEAEAECHKLAKVDPKNADAYYRLSIIALERQDPGLAEQYLNKAMKLGEADEETYYRLAVGYAKVNRYGAAETSYKKCIEKNPKRYEAWAGLADVQLKAGKDSVAAETYMDIAQFELDEYREYPAMAGKIFERLGHKEKAREAYNFYLGHRNVSEDINVRLARIEYENKNYEAVHRLLGNQMMKGSLSKEDNIILARSYMAMEEYRKALPLLERAIAEQPDFREAIEQAVDAAEHLEETQKTIELLKKYLALPRTQRHNDHAYRVGQLYLQLRDRKSARDQFAQNIVDYPNDIRNYEELAKLCTELREWDCAQQTLESAVKLPSATVKTKQMLAALYERLNMPDRAASQYEDYLTDAPNDSSALLSAGTLYYNRREYDQAIAYLKKAHSLMPQNFESAYMLGDSYLKQGKVQEATDAFLEARRIKSKDVRVLESLATCYKRLNDTRSLVPILREWLFLDGANVEVKKQLGMSLLQTHNTSEGCRLLESACRERPDDVETRRLLAKTYKDMGDEDAFIRHVKEALEHADSKADLHHELAQYYMRQKRMDLAQQYFQKAVDESPTLAPARFELAQIYRRAGNTLQAYKEAQKCVEHAPYDPTYLALYSQVAYQMNKPEVAMDAIMRAIEQDSTNAANLGWAGHLYNRLRQTDQAKVYLNRSIRLDPNGALCHEYLGDAYLFEGLYEKAAQHFEKSLAVRAYSEQTSLKLAKSVLLSGQPRKAGLLFEKILNMNRRNDEALYWLSHVFVTLGRIEDARKLPVKFGFTTKTGWLHLAQGEIYEAEGNINAALIAFTVASRLIPDEPLMLAATGRMHLAKREYEQAVVSFGKALGQDPHNPQYLLELGKAYEGLTDYSSAIDIYQEVIKTNPQLAEVHYLKARALSKSGDHSKSIEALLVAVSKAPNEHSYRMALGHEYRASSQHNKAIEAYEKITGNEGPDAVDALRYIGITYYENLKETSKAKRYFERYVKAGGKDSQVQELLAKMP